MRMKTQNKRFSRIGRIGIGIANLVVVGVVLLAFTAKTSTPEFVDSDGSVLQGSIAEECSMKIGGVDQTVYLRGRDRTAPILVFVHGGPGATATPFLRTFNSDLENDFVVAYWDQRGTSKSYDESLDSADMTIAQITADLDELIDQLLAEFDQEQVLLAAHSWGTIVGIEYAAANPQKLAAYIAISQTTGQIESDEIGYEWAMAEARAAGNENAITQLEEIGTPEYTIEEFYTQRRWVNVLGGGLYEHQSDLALLRTALSASEFGWTDLRSFFQGNRFSAEALWDEQQKYDARERHQSFETPIYFINGRHDRLISPDLSAEYFETIETPQKELIWFEQSAHSPLFEQPEKFNQLMIEIAEETDMLP